MATLTTQNILLVYNRELDKLMQLTNNDKWLYYVKTVQQGRQGRYPTYHFREVLNSKPTGSTPASVTPMSLHTVKFTGTMQLKASPPAPEPITTFHSFKLSIPSAQRTPLLDLSNLEDIPHIVESIKLGNCALVTDGSYFESSSQAAAAYVLGNEAYHRRIIGRCHVVGPPASYSSYCSELAGLHGGLLFLLGLCKAYRIQNGRIIVACDNKGSLQKLREDT